MVLASSCGSHCKRRKDPVQQERGQKREPLIHFSGAGPTLLIMAVVVGALVAILFLIGESKSEGFSGLRAAIALPLLLMLGLGTLLLLLTSMVAVLNKFGLTDPRRAFGLPDGSMQAVIALSLVLIFVIASLYLYSSLPQTVSADQETAHQDRFDFAKQLLTTVGTLAVAVAGFYFGTRSVEAAAAATERGETEEPITIVEPQGTPTLDLTPGTELSPIRVATKPPGLPVIGFVALGDDWNRVEQLATGEFRYVRGSAAQAVVTLAFQLADGTARTELDVHAVT